jgi:hypothetical protein
MPRRFCELCSKYSQYTVAGAANNLPGLIIDSILESVGFSNLAETDRLGRESGSDETHDVWEIHDYEYLLWLYVGCYPSSVTSHIKFRHNS